VPNGWRQPHAQLGFEHWVLDGPLDPKRLGFVIYLVTLATAEIISAKNARAWVSMVSYLKKKKIMLKI
jgi:hypothetical protein